MREAFLLHSQNSLLPVPMLRDGREVIGYSLGYSFKNHVIAPNLNRCDVLSVALRSEQLRLSEIFCLLAPLLII